MKRFTFTVSTEGNYRRRQPQPRARPTLRRSEGGCAAPHLRWRSTASITTLEFEPGLVKHDLPRILQQIAPDDGHYDHEATWNDDNGHSHVRSALLGPGLTIPVSQGKLLTGEWQQVVLIDFDTRPRRRNIICTLID
jgi:secondary thiamine-phosphate synthase enzyme